MMYLVSVPSETPPPYPQNTPLCIAQVLEKTPGVIFWKCF